MKTWFFIGVFLLLLFTGCNPTAIETPYDTSLPELAAIDTLMQSRPDSALAMLLDEPMDDPYYQLLLSEALYKNDYAQANRAELLGAMAYFDSVGNAFLSARCHYMNGVGHYEVDSVVPACEQYLKALEIMEEHFDEKELTGHKAKFMALTYNRLGDLFSGQFMMDPAICCYKKAIAFNVISPTSRYGIANNLFHIGVEFDKAEMVDSANTYYDMASESLPDTLNLVYRNIQASRIYSDCHLTNKAESSCNKLKYLADLTDDKQEKLVRYLAIGSIYFENQLYDSSEIYLQSVFDSCTYNILCIQAADYLRFIYEKHQNTEKAGKYTLFLSKYTIPEIKQKVVQSQLADLFQKHQQNVHEKHYWDETNRKNNNRIGFVVSLIVMLTIFLMIIRRVLKSNSSLSEENKILAKAKELSIAIPNQTKRKYSDYAELLRETVSLNLIGRFNKTEIITTNKTEFYSKLACTTKEKRMLVEAVERHCPNYVRILRSCYPSLNTSDLELCRYYLLGLTDQQIAVLLQKHYSTIWRHSTKLKKTMKCIELQKHITELLFESKK